VKKTDGREGGRWRTGGRGKHGRQSCLKESGRREGWKEGREGRREGGREEGRSYVGEASGSNDVDCARVCPDTSPVEFYHGLRIGRRGAGGRGGRGGREMRERREGGR
jgi:hypothetical protein